MSTKAKSPGRPKGRKTDTAVLSAPLPHCIKCDATEFAVLKKISEQQIRGRTQDGQAYTSIVRRRVRCEACGQHQVHITRPFDPEKWPEADEN